jgi:hypothetical protein
MSLDETLWDRHEKYDLQEEKTYECKECKKEFKEKDCVTYPWGEIYLNTRKKCICLKCDVSLFDEDEVE